MLTMKILAVEERILTNKELDEITAENAKNFVEKEHEIELLIPNSSQNLFVKFRIGDKTYRINRNDIITVAVVLRQ